jgi:hypothetical protein
MGSDLPVYSDSARSSIGQWMGPIVVVYLVVHSLVTNQGIALVMAIPLAMYVAYTWHTGYHIYRDTLVVQYFLPRRMVVPLAEIVHVRQAKIFPAGDGLLLSRAKGPLFIRPRAAAQLHDLLNERIGPRQQPEQPTEGAPAGLPRRTRAKRRRR